MKIALTQMNIAWEDKEQNKETCVRFIREAVKKNVDCIVFPEMTLTGFTMNTVLCSEDKKTSETITFFKNLSKQYQIAIVFGYIEKHPNNRDNKALNKLMLVDCGETIFEYAKIHPFSYGEETKYYEKGNEIVTGTLRGMEVGAFICYDLRFPEIFQISSRKSKMIFVIANWPEERIEHWETLLKARAIENQCYIVGVNRIGNGGGLMYQPSSVAFDCYGKKLTENTKDEWMCLDIEESLVDEYRKNFQVRQDRREELYASIVESF